MRITKDRETRRAEIIGTAIALFLEKGYADTMVSDIVKRVGVAQGTFYYYFRTKEDVLDAALEQLLREGVERVARLAADDCQTASVRLEGLFRMLFSPRGSIEVDARYRGLLQDQSVHARMEAVRFRMLHGVLSDLIGAGIRYGEFRRLRFPSEAAEIALKGASAFMRERHMPLVAADTMLDALAEFMENLLGMPEGALNFKDRVIRIRA